MSISNLYGDIPNNYYAFGANGAETAESIVFGSSCTEIGAEAFQANNSFINSPYKGLIGPLIIPDSVITVGVRAFQNCEGLTSLTLGKNVETLKAEAFRSCAGLTGSLIIPASVTSIAGYVFYNCSSLETLYIEVPVEAWVDPNYPVPRNFFSCPALTNIYIPAEFIAGYDTQWRIDQALQGSVVISEWVGYHQAPTLNPIEAVTFEVEEVFSLQVVASDPEAGVLTYSATGLPTGLSIDPATGLISGTISAGAEFIAPFNVTVTVVDNGSPNRSGNTSFYMFGPKLTNTVPTIKTLIPDQVSFVADVISLQVQGLAVDPDAPLTYSAEGLPAGLSIDPATGLISGTISAGAEALSPYATVVTVTDSGSPLIKSNEFVFNWEVFPEVIFENTYFFDNPSKTFPELFQKVGPISDLEYQGNDDIRNVTFGTSCTSIGDYAFYNCYSFGSGGVIIEIGGGVTSIGDYAFHYTAVTQMAILNNVKTIGNNLFLGQMGGVGSALFIDTPASSWEGPAFRSTESPTLYIRDIYRHGYDDLWEVNQGYNNTYSLGILNWDNYPEYIPNAVSGNQFPDIEQIPTQISLEEDVISLQVVATDPDNVDEQIDILTYSATGLPAGLSIDPATGLISGTTVLGAEASSPYEVLITVSDDGDPITTKNMLFIWEVTGENTAATITTIPEQENEELDVISLQVNAIDAQGHNLTYSATGLPTGLSIDPATGLISGTISAGAEAVGPVRTIVTVTDDGDPIESSEEAFNWYVPVRPTSSTAYNYSGTPIGTVATDIPNVWKNSIGAYNIHSIEIGTACTSIGDSSFSFCYNLSGDVVIPSNVTSIGTYAFAYGTSVENYYLDVPATVFQTSFAQTWFGTQTTILHVSPEHLAGYTQPWADNNSWYGQILEWQNYPNPIPNPNIAPVIPPIDDQTNYEVDDFVSLYFNGTDAGGGDWLTYTIVEPAEGLFPSLGLAFSSSEGRVSGNIKEGAASGSPYTIIVKCTDNGIPPLDSEPVEFTWTVEVPNQAPVLDPISTQNSEELDVISLQITYTDLENNNITFSATGLPTGLSIDPVTGLISGTISAGAEGSNPYVATITITDDGLPVKGDSLALIWTVGSVLAENELNRYYDASGTLINAFEGVIPFGLGSDPNRINGDTSLVSLEFGTTCTSIQGTAFRDCFNLNSPLIIGDGIGNSISNIGSYAFYNCGSLTGPVVIGSSVTAIGDWAFAYDGGFSKRPRIDEMYVDVPSDIWGNYIFGGFFNTSYDSMVIYVSPTYFGVGTNYGAGWRSSSKVNGAVQIVNWDNYPIATPNV